MKRWLAGSLLVALAGVILAGVLLVILINSNRDPIAVLEEFGAKHEKEYAVRTIERNEKGEVVEVILFAANMPREISDELMHAIGLGPRVRSFGDAEMVHLKGLTALQTLELHSPQVTDAGLACLKGLTELQTLDLSGTKITDAGLVHL
ncbi:MAG: hypothetical protein VB862_13130, partial [Pirellulaceae bacterium]